MEGFVEGLVFEGFMVEVVAEDTEGEDGDGEDVAAGVRAADYAGEGAVVVFCFVCVSGCLFLPRL